MSKKTMSVAFYEKNDLQKKRILNYRRKKILNGNDKLLLSMMMVVEKNLKDYFSDFYIHDLEQIENHNRKEFLWIVREYGTHYIDLHSEHFTQDNEWYSVLYFNEILENSRHGIVGIYLYEKGILQKINEAKAILILQKYENQIREKLKTTLFKAN